MDDQMRAAMTSHQLLAALDATRSPIQRLQLIRQALREAELRGEARVREGYGPKTVRFEED